MLKDEPEDERGSEPLTPIYPYNRPGEAIDLYSGPIGGLYDEALEGTIRLVPYPSPSLRWQMDLPDAQGYSAMDRLGNGFDLSAGGMTGRGQVSSTSFGSTAGVSSTLEFESREPIERALVHWMNLPAYKGNVVIRYVGDDGSKTWTSGRLELKVEGWSITLDGRPDSSSLFREDVGLSGTSSRTVADEDIRVDVLCGRGLGDGVRVWVRSAAS